jgi:DNA-binding CsgD family transcriptional regulator
MATRFEEDFMRFYNQKNVKFFSEWCKRVYPLLGNVSQAGVIETNSNGNILIAANHPDVGVNCLMHEIYKKHLGLTYVKGFEGKKYIIDSNDYYYDHESDQLRMQIFATMFREKVTDDIQRVYWLASEDQSIHNAVINNLFSVEKVLKKFSSEIETIIDRCREDQINMAEIRSDYFIDNDVYEIAELGKFNALLKDKDILCHGKGLTDKEFECLKKYLQGKSAQETSKVLGISRRTVENHFDKIKKKLNVTSKAEILDAIIGDKK